MPSNNFKILALSALLVFLPSAWACPMGYDIDMRVNPGAGMIAIKPDERGLDLSPPFVWQASSNDVLLEMKVQAPSDARRLVWPTTLTVRSALETRSLDVSIELPQNFVRHTHIAIDQITKDLWQVDVVSRCGYVQSS